jgi:hypothetical protein
MQCTALCLLISSWLSLHGYAAPQREAVLHNIWLESRFHPCVTAGRGSAFLLQWLGPRRVALQRFARTVGCPMWVDQLRFATLELGAPRYAAFWATDDAGVAYREMRRRFGRGR